MTLKKDVVSWYRDFKRIISFNDILGIWTIILGVSVTYLRRYINYLINCLATFISGAFI